MIIDQSDVGSGIATAPAELIQGIAKLHAVSEVRISQV